jgi:transcriptional regulator with XRE-family HTH domain
MDNKEITSFGWRVKSVRKHFKLLQKEFSKKLDISVTSLSEIENDKSRPGYDFFAKIAREYDVNLYYLLFGEGDMFYRSAKLDEILPVESFINSLDNEDVRDFLRYFLGSKIVQFRMLSFFKEFLIDKEISIKQELEKIKTGK